MVMTLMDANQNSHSPKARVPKKLMTITTKPIKVIQAALLMVSFQSKYERSLTLLVSIISGECKDAQLMRTAAADNSAGRVTTQEYQ